MDSSLTTARDRIASTYSPRSFRELGNSLVEILSQHFERLQERNSCVLNWNAPETNIPVARQTLTGRRAENPSELSNRFQELIELAIQRGQNLHHPRYIGHQVPASVPIAGLFDALGSITNQVMAIYEMGPWVTSVERVLIEEWGEQIGLARNTFAGAVTHGGSLANLTALLTARNVCLGTSWTAGISGPKPPVLVVHTDSHYCVTRAAGILGIGTEHCVKVPLDPKRRMNPNALNDILVRLRKSGTPIVAVSSAACATPIGAFDPLDDIADVCERHDVWMHVDAAHGGAVSFSEQHQHLIEGITRADSFICDAHKTLFVPALCAFVFYKDRTHKFETFQQDAPYLFDPSAPGMADIDSGMTTIECTKRAAVFGLWGLWSLFGREIFADFINVTFELTRMLYEKLSSEVDFEPLHEPECNIQVFRYLPPSKHEMTQQQIGELNRMVRRRLIESGDFYIVQTNLDGVGALRVVVMNPLTNESDLDQLLVSIRETALTLLNG